MTPTITTITTTLDSPIGPLTLTASDGYLTGLFMDEQRHAPSGAADWERDDSFFDGIAEQLGRYFSGDLTGFDIPMRLVGTEFQRQVWEGLLAIPYGETVSYGELARRIGRPRAQRAIGQANGRNPIAVIIPCHRVVASDGSLGGYGGGPDRKTWLLRLESPVDRAGEPGPRP